MQAETAQSHRWAGVHGPDVQPDVPRAPQPCTVPAPERAWPCPDIPLAWRGREGKSSPFPKGFQLNFSSYTSLWSLLPIQLHILALWRHSNVKHLPHKHFFSSKANTLSVTRTISLKHEQRVRFPQTKELKVSF